MRNLLIATLALTLFACGDSDTDSNNSGTNNGTTAGTNNRTTAGTNNGTTAKNTSVVATFNGLEDLGADFVYEGWIITSDGPVSAGRFSVTTDPTEFTFEADTEIAMGTKYVLTIEPKANDVPAPASTHVLAGDLTDGSATLTAADGAALGDDFSTAAGSVFLQTPSTAGADDFNNGVWFFDPTGNPPLPLTLPTLPAGWKYEGWVVTADGPISTGTFTATDVADDDGKGATAGPDGTPPIPGSDFISPPIDLSTSTAVISIEPDPDNAAAPFAFKPLVVKLASPAAGVPTAFTLNLTSFPTGSVKVSLK